MTSTKTDRIIRWVMMGGVILLLSTAVWWVVSRPDWSKTTVMIGQAIFHAEVVNTDRTRAQGLSGRDGLELNQAMLLEFEDDAMWAIWMKGMKFPIDIIWLDKNKQVVHIESNVEPEGSPYTEYRPPVPARYVLEISAGGANKSNIKVGSVAKFDLDKEDL